ncbi:MAG: hypothetical protein AAB443_02015 [Patescibacteria group bacterium]
MIPNLLTKSSNWKKEADKILNNSDLLKVLRKYGEVEFTGSYSYDLMLCPDVDMFLILDTLSKTNVKSIVDALIDQGFWNRIKYTNFLEFPHTRYNNSFYIGLKADINGITWKMDIWLVSKDSVTDFRENWVTDKLTNESKLTILNLKKNKKVDESSYDIYNAVLNHQIKTYKDFLKWKVSKKSD